MTTSTWLSFTAWMSSSLSLKIGSDSRCACMGRDDFWPNVGAFPNASTFHWGISYPPRPTPLSSAARCRSPASGMGSSQGRLRSFGIDSTAALCCCSLSSLLSFARALCVIAARCKLPSGFFTILIGDTSPSCGVCPAKNGASSSLISISTSCSASSSYASTPFFPPNADIPPGKTPDAMSCFASTVRANESLHRSPPRASAILSPSDS